MEPGPQFALIDGPPSKARFRILLIAAPLIIGGAAVASFLPVEGFGIMIMGLIPLGLARVLWAGCEHGRATMTLADDGLTITTNGGTIHKYKWSHIQAIDARPFRDCGLFARLARRLIPGDADNLVVFVKLNKPLRSPWRGGNFGTAIAGIPTFVKSTILTAEDPSAATTAAKEFIR